MNLRQLIEQLDAAQDSQLVLQLPSGDCVAAHFHVTEVGKVTKDFVDCGGTRRTEKSCVMQTLVASDVDHRLQASKLRQILELTADLELEVDLPVDFEVQGETIQIFSLEQCVQANSQLQLLLSSKQTACLAPDRCNIPVGLPTLGSTGCGGTGCC